MFSVHNTNWLIYVMQLQYVFFEAGIHSLNIWGNFQVLIVDQSTEHSWEMVLKAM